MTARPLFDPFAFSHVPMPDGATGRYQTIATLLRAIGWVAFGGGVMAVLTLLFVVGFGGWFLLDGGSFGGFIAVIMVLQFLATAAAAYLFMVWAGRGLHRWADAAGGSRDDVKNLGTGAIIGGAILFLVMGATLMGLGLLGLGIAVLVMVGDAEFPSDQVSTSRP